MSKSPLSESRFRYAFAAWWLIWTVLHALLIGYFGFSPMIATLDSVITNIQMLAACLLVNIILKYYLPRKEQYLNILLLGAGLSVLVVLDSRWILSYILNDDSTYLTFLARSLPVRFDMSFLLIICLSFVWILWYVLEEKQEQEKRKADAERLAKEAELYKLRQQLQPHFLFNSLNSISALAGSKPEEARKMIQQLSDFLRGTLKKEDEQWVKLPDELQYLQLYLDIEKVRFGYRLTTVVESDPASEGMKMPSMLLQPIVENAIKFGLYDTTEAVTIRISASAQGNNLEILVQNPYDPETSYPKQGTGFGLNSLKRRLYLLFARNDLVVTRAENNLFTTIVRIPQTA
ncbi:MAG: sensor histidine kinase [Chitinophagales bacterium]